MKWVTFHPEFYTIEANKLLLPEGEGVNYRERELRTLLKSILVILITISLTLLTACDQGANGQPDSLRIFFIGNSLTYTNDLPGMLQKLLEQADINAVVESAALPNYGLQDHWANPDTVQRIADGNWDVVVLQQGPSATEGRPSLLEYSKMFNDFITQAGSRTALYMVWPWESRSFDFDGVSESYRMAAEQVDGLLFPAGEAWRAAWRKDPNLGLYGPDDFHPSELGTYLAALVMYEQLAKKDPRQLPASIPTSSGERSIPENVATILQESAVEANEEFAR